MLEQLVNNKVMGVLVGEYNQSPNNFLNNIQKKIKIESTSSKLPFATEETVIGQLLFSKKYNWKDYGEAFEFLNSKGYDFLKQQKITNRLSSDVECGYKIIKTSELVSFINLLDDNRNKDLEPLLATYMKNQATTELFDVFKDAGFDFYRFVENNNLELLKNVVPPLIGNQKGENLLNVFRVDIVGEINIESFKELDEESRNFFIQGIKDYADKNLLQTELGAKRPVSTLKKVSKVLSILKNDLSVQEKSDFLRLIPQRLYYKEVSAALGFRFSSKDFVGTPWDRLIDFSIINRDYNLDGSRESSVIKFKIENAWNKWVIESEEKFKHADNHRGGNIVVAFASLYTEIYSSSEMFQPESKRGFESNNRNGSGFNLNIVTQKFYNDPRFIDFIVDEFERNKNFRSNFADYQIVLDKQPEFASKLDNNLLISATFSSYQEYFSSSMLEKMSFLEKSGISCDNYVMNMADEEQKKVARIIMLYNSKAGVSNSYLFSVVSSLKTESFINLLSSEEFNNADKEMQAIFQKSILDRRIKLDSNDDSSDSTNIFKI